MRKYLIFTVLFAAWVHPADAKAQFAPNAPQGVSPPANSTFLPRATGGQRLNSSQFYPLGYGNPFNNYYNGVFGYNGFGNNNYGPYGNNGFTGYGSPLANPWQNNYGPFGGGPFGGGPFGGGPFGGGPFGGGFNAYQTPWGFGNGLYNSAPFGGYSYNGYGNFAPIVGLNNGWWPYQPAYNYNSPINQYLNQLYLQGLPGSGPAPSSLNGKSSGILPPNP